MLSGCRLPARYHSFHFYLPPFFFSLLLFTEVVISMHKAAVVMQDILVKTCESGGLRWVLDG